MFAGQKVLLQQLKAFGLAILICSLLIGGMSIIVGIRTEGLARSVIPPKYAPNYQSGDIAAYIRLTLKSKRNILIIGSCELTDYDIVPVIANNFIRENWGVPVLAFGHGGMQSIAIAAQLAAYFDDLKNARVVIILSPDWFSELEVRTTLPAFFEFMPIRLLARYYFNRSIPTDARERIDGFLYGYKSHIKFLNNTMAAILSRYEKVSLLKQLIRVFNNAEIYFSEYFSLRFLDAYDITRLASKDFSEKDSPMFAEKTVEWEKLIKEADERFEKLSIKNSYGFLDAPYESFYRQQGPWPQPMKKALLNGEEFKDFKAMVEILKAAKCRPLFVMLGLNPKAFTNLDTFEPLIQDIKSVLTKNNMPVVDLWHEPYHPSSFSGPLQLGDYAWLKINRAIYDYFIRNKT